MKQLTAATFLLLLSCAPALHAAALSASSQEAIAGESESKFGDERSRVISTRILAQEDFKATSTPENNNNLPVKNKLSPSAFEITADDETLFLTLRRWSSENGYQLVWDASKDFPVKKAIYDASHIYEAIEMVMKDTENSTYPLHACAYANSVIRVLHISQACTTK